jgi:hypothetical protein
MSGDRPHGDDSAIAQALTGFVVAGGSMKV